MNIGEVLVRFGAETSGFMGGLRLIQAGMSGLGGFVKGAFSDMNSGLHSITSGFQTMGTGAGGVFASMRTGAADVGTGMLKLGAVMALVGSIAAVAIGVTVGVVAVRAAADFQQGLNRLVTGAGNATDNMKTLGQGILGVSVATGTLTGGTNGLLAAMYLIDSAGQRGAQSLDTLRAAAQGAKIEQASLTAVTQILTTLQTNFGLHTYTATQYMNGLVAAVSHGKISLEDLSTAMSPILPNAHQLGIHFADVAAAMSDMTNQGIPADQAATALRFVMQSMIQPTKASSKAMLEWGLDTNKVAAEMKVSLPGAIQMYIDAAKRAGPEGSKPFIDALAEMMGGGQRAAKALNSLSQSMGTWKTDIVAINTALGQNTSAVMGWETVQGSFNIKVGQAHAALEAVFITIGTHLLPVLTQIVGSLVPILQRFAEWVTHTNAIENAIKAATPFFNAMFDIIRAALPTVIGLFLQFMAVLAQVFKWVAQHKEIMEALMVIMKALGIIIVAVVAAGLLTLVGTFILLSAAIIAVMAVVAGLIAIWRLLVTAANWVAGAWNSAVAFLVALWHTLVAAATSAFNAVKNAIVSAFNAAIAWVVGAWQSAIAFIVGIWHTLSGAATSVFNAVKTAIMTAVNAVITWLVGAWNTCVQAVVAAFTWLYNHNYYWQALVDFIRNAVQSVISWLQGAWTNVVNFLVGLWNTIAGAASSAFNATTAAISSAVDAAISWLQGAWNSAIAWLGGAWNTMAGLAQAAWNAVAAVFSSVWGTISGILSSLWASISGWFSSTAQGMQTKTTGAWQGVSSVFSSAWGTYIAGPLNSLAGNIGGFFNGLVGQMIQYGRNLIQGLVDGINSMLGSVASAASNVASTIASFLGFHKSIFTPPKEGPASRADNWAPDLMKGFAEGLLSGQSQLAKASSQVMGPVRATMSGGASGSSGAGGGSSSRPIIIQVGNREYRAFVDNLGNDLVGSSTVRVHFAGGR